MPISFSWPKAPADNRSARSLRGSNPRFFMAASSDPIPEHLIEDRFVPPRRFEATSRKGDGQGVEIERWQIVEQELCIVGGNRAARERSPELELCGQSLQQRADDHRMIRVGEEQIERLVPLAIE